MAIVRSFFDPDPPPDGMDQGSSEWLMRQFRRLSDSLADSSDEEQDAWTVSPLSSQVSELRQQVMDLEQEVETLRVRLSTPPPPRYSWKDLLGPVTGINPLGAASDPDIDPADGALLFDDTTEEVIAAIYQVNHDWAGGVLPEGLEGRLHVHWSKTSNAAGDVEWEYCYRVFSAGDVPPAWSSWAAADTRSEAVDATQKQIIDGFPAIDLSGQEVSCIISVQVRRNPAAGDDTYGADAKLWSMDIHYLCTGGDGSDLEYTKLNWSS